MSKEIIKEIVELNEYIQDKTYNYNKPIEGYKIITNKQEIKLYIEGDQQCCEQFGYFMSNDNIEEFIGTELIEIKLTDIALNEVKMKENELDVNNQWFGGGIMFVDINTNIGSLQFVAYNQHNGCYGHNAVIESTQLNHEEYL